MPAGSPQLECNSFNIKIHGHKIILMAKVLRFLSTQFSIKISIHQNFAFARSWGRRQNSRMIIFLAFHSSRWAATKSKEPVQTILWPLLVRVNAEASSSMTSRFAFIVPEKRKRFCSVALHNHWINWGSARPIYRAAESPPKPFQIVISSHSQEFS